ncbi:MAG: rRNA (Adenine-N(6)-)-methyltransferase [Candidatus Woesebacteria bacterium GW2011_GWA1_37_7]|uniref:rRNA (Adenine-N(6)-)-methyltransferase n=1 Tax=Candidatus Woesebacteria bacterium GW2011_GWA1_37_7 TaxID=1618545 RepID=A0A0G0GZR5_9BACT|nr:MAG: rRNA (Adenine-N(6)-)-methyltransferase [Candidatus Woesebacteria bacterium GW2011_GWA1_37_7]
MKKINRNQKLWQSQNFIRRPELVSDLLKETDIGKDDLVVEIGPGKGVITRKLAEIARKVVAVEKDPRLVNKLKAEFSESPNVNIVEADFLTWHPSDEPHKVFSNIPFQATADIVAKITTPPNTPEESFLIVQKEAAERFIDSPHKPKTQAAVLLEPFYETTVVRSIDRREFEPVPNVDAVLARFRKREKPLIDENKRQSFRDFVIYGFNQWQPTIGKSLSKVFSERQLNRMEHDLDLEGLKPSEVTAEKWRELYKRYEAYVPEDKKRAVRGEEKRLREKQKTMQKSHRTRRS